MIQPNSGFPPIDYLSLLSDETKELMRDFENEHKDPREFAKTMLEAMGKGGSDVSGN